MMRDTVKRDMEMRPKRCPQVPRHAPIASRCIASRPPGA